MIQRGEINYASVYVTEWSLMFFYGDGSGFGPSLTEADADAELVYDSGFRAEVPSVYNNNASSGDLDGDGAWKLSCPWALLIRQSSTVSSESWWFPGPIQLRWQPRSHHHTIRPHHPEQVYMARPAQDLDGDGYSDVLVTSYLWSPNYDSASDEDSPIAGELTLGTSRCDW